MTERFYNEMRRHYYTTPSSYLELLKLYLKMLATKKSQIIKQRDRVSNGLQKLYETNSVIDSMKATLQAMEPELAKKSIAVAELMKNLAVEQKQADKVRIIVKKDEDEAKVIFYKLSVSVLNKCIRFNLGKSRRNTSFSR